MSEPRTGRQPRVGHRRSTVDIEPGKRAEIDAATWAAEREARALLAEAKRQLSNATRRLERQLGNAQFGTIGGRVVLERVRLDTGGSYAPVNHRALIKPVTGPGT